MLLPGRHGYSTQGGWAQGGNGISGVPATLSLSSRVSNTPSEYIASREIEFTAGFESGTGDAFEAYISDGSSGSGGTGAASGYASGGYRYGFNGKENDNEVKGEGNQQDYGMRIYDPRLGRFLSVDPLTTKYPMLTPFQFASNTPIVAIDLDGLEGEWMNKAIWEGREQIREKYGNSAAKEYDSGVKTGAAFTTVTVVDILVTKGWLYRTLMGSQVIGAFEHNRAKTPEGRVAQGQRRNEALSTAFIGWGFGWATSKIIGTAITYYTPIKEEVKYLFRGTSRGFEGNASLQKVAMTPTSSDPTIATIFAIQSKNYGQGVLHIALPKNLQGVEYSANVLNAMEKEIAVGLKPIDFAAKSSITITADQASGILKNMGINLPSKISLGDVSSVIKNTPKLTQSQIDEFYKQATKLQIK